MSKDTSQSSEPKNIESNKSLRNEDDAESQMSQSTTTDYSSYSSSASFATSSSASSSVPSSSVNSVNFSEMENELEDLAMNSTFFESMNEDISRSTNETESNSSSIDQLHLQSVVTGDANQRRFEKLTRTVQSYLNASSSARNFILTASMNHRVKRLINSNMRKRKSKETLNSPKFETKNMLFKHLMSKYEAQESGNQLITDLKSSMEKTTPLSKSNSKKLRNLFFKFECYLTSILMPVTDNYELDAQKNIFKKNCEFDLLDNDLEESETKNESKDFKQNPAEFFTCPLCAHCLLEPITLVCGCTYCKKCLNEYTAFQSNINAKNELKKFTQFSSYSELNEDPSKAYGIDRSSETVLKKPEYECYNCGKSHEKNSSDYLKVNTLITLLTEKLWTPNIEVKKLRNEIRSYVIFELENNSGKLNIEKCEYLFRQAYERDQSNHLILVDLFLVNYFSGHYEKSKRYVDEVIDLKPDWVVGHFLRSIVSEVLEDTDELILSLENCLRLDQSLKYIKKRLHIIKKYEMYKLNSKSTQLRKSSHSRKRASEELLCDLKKSDLAISLRDSSLKKRLKKVKTSHLQLNDIVTDKTTDLQKIATNSTTSCLASSLSSPSSFKVESSQEAKSTYITDCAAKSEMQQDDKKTSSGLRQFENMNIDMSDSKKLPTADEAPIPTLLIERNIENTDSSIVDKTINPVKLTFDENARKFYIDNTLIKITDVECSLCYRIMYQPVSTPCGHSYCSSCLDRSLDHQNTCPLCKSSLDEYLAERRKFVTNFLEKIIKTVFITEFEEREKQYNELLQELVNDESEVPIFVCTLALPFARCPLHIFEPRYRLMLRRAIESGSNQFGMCMYGERTPYLFTDYGCMLEIRNYQFTRDGRAVVATVGGRRFKVIKVSVKDGYNVAKIQWVCDKRVEDEQEKAELQALHDEVYQLSLNWYSFIPNPQKQKIREIYGISDMPTPETDIQSNDNGPVWHWFLLNILPLENDFQYRFLTKTSLKERLKQIKRIVLVLMTPLERPLVSSRSENNVNRTNTSTESTPVLTSSPNLNSNSNENTNTNSDSP